MAYFIDLFSPETYDAFSKSARDTSGFRLRQRGVASRVHPGDTLVCYVTRLSRWCGLLDVVEGPFIDNAPIFVPEDDPFVVRFRVKARVWLPLDESPPIRDAAIWKGLSFTRNLPDGSIAWTGKVRGSLVQLDKADAVFLDSKLGEIASSHAKFPLSDDEEKALHTHTIVRADKVVSVTVPEDKTVDQTPSTEPDVRESIRIQALIAEAGAKMGLSVWVPAADRGRVMSAWKGEPAAVLQRLPLNYDDTTLRTIEQIDVLWLRGRSIVRAFEVEHTTSVYSGILRMADLLALQPNMDIKLHIVAPIERRDKVFSEIRRPVFSLLEKGPLADSCTYLSYESVKEVAALKHLPHLSDSVLDEYAEETE